MNERADKLTVTLLPSESRSEFQLVNAFAKALQDGLQGLDSRLIAQLARIVAFVE